MRVKVKRDFEFGGCVAVLILAALIVGEVKCIVKAVSCNWEPIGKAEVVYTASALTGVGCVVGWIDIQDK